jgi:hypothetical protein
VLALFGHFTAICTILLAPVFALHYIILFIPMQHFVPMTGESTKGVNQDTADGFSEAYVNKIIGQGTKA